jgi:hypothetical protein
VDEKMVEVQDQIEEVSTTADQLEGLISSMEKAVRTTEELQALAVELEKRLADLPEETIKQLVEILEQYLEQR